MEALRVAYRNRLLHLATRDVTGECTLAEAAAALADLASAALEAALAIARAEVADAGDVRLAVIGMGKCGARELNYISDVDVVFVAEPKEGVDETKALQTATRLAQGMMRACSASTPEGALWEVDANLRPEGKMGPLVRSMESHLAYFRRWAKTWEFQALLKARPVAGDLELGQEYVAVVNELVWQAAARPHFVEDVQAMRRRVEAHVPAGEADRQIKLGPGGLRDIEFAVQLLQLVHGRSDPLLRRRATLSALAALSRGGYVGRDDAKALAEAYTFLRQVEHMLQLHRLRRTHMVPSDTADLRRLGRGLGMTTDPVGSSPPPGSGTRWRCGGSTRSCSTARCCRPSPGCRRPRPACPRPPPPRGWRRSATPTPRARCVTSPRSPAVSLAGRPSSGPCCRSCSAGSPTRPTPTPACSASVR
ncbi:hypothetical protein GCM10027612_36460 [Microbispora bryophytorum subsp. camponoti]